MRQVETLDVVVIGAGVVGLAIGRALAAAGMDPVVVERHRRVGEETSSRNSGVVHSGIHYATNSLKATLCVRGRQLLYAYCQDRGVTHRRLGKLIVAQQEQMAALTALHRQGIANGLEGLQWLDAAAARDLEPAVRCAAALFSPDTGIVDVHEFMTALQGDLESHGGAVLLDAEVERLRVTSDGLQLMLRGADADGPILSRRVVNAAGLGAVALARRIEGHSHDRIPVQRLAKGSYFCCAGRPFRHLVYPMPSEAGLGIHATLDLDGSVRFGPDVEWVEDIDYSVDEGRSNAFYASIREYWPDLPDGALTPAYAGVRPKVVGPGQMPADFMIVGPADHGAPGLVNLFGIESPGLTAALAIGEHVAQMLH